MALPARRLDLPGAPPPPLPPSVRRGAARGPALSSAAGTATAQPSSQQSSRPWSRDALAGRLVELSDTGGGAPLTMAAALVLDAQRRKETVAWITSRESAFFPPDLAANGVDLDALAVVRISGDARGAPAPGRSDDVAARIAARASHGTATAAAKADVLAARVAARRGVPSRQAALARDGQAAARAAERLLRSGAFGLVVLDLGEGDVAMPLQARLLGLAERHDAALLVLTRKPCTAPSLSSLVSLRVETARRRADDGSCVCALTATKDKRRPPGWSVEQACAAPAGFR